MLFKIPQEKFHSVKRPFDEYSDQMFSGASILHLRSFHDASVCTVDH